VASARRRRAVYACLIPVVALVALGTRRFPEHLPRLVAQYGGDTLWALAAFLLLGIAFPSLGTMAVAAVTFAVSCLVEVSQLYHAPWIDSVRATTVGGLVLGFEFLWSDLACYLTGVVLGALLEGVVLRRVAFATRGE